MEELIRKSDIVEYLEQRRKKSVALEAWVLTDLLSWVNRKAPIVQGVVIEEGQDEEKAEEAEETPCR